ncbi:MAG: hypothetical protein RLZZ124_339 [Cyanobacteriota bacterium]
MPQNDKSQDPRPRHPTADLQVPAHQALNGPMAGPPQPLPDSTPANGSERPVSTSGDAKAPDSPGPGRRLGLELRRCLAEHPERPPSSQMIANRLIDALGADDSLRGPVRDLTSRPQLMQALRGEGGSRQAAMLSLSRELGQTYAPAVLNQLLDLLESAGDISVPRPGNAPIPPEPATMAGTGPEQAPPCRHWRPLLTAVAPGACLAASATLVFTWLAQEVDRGLLDGWGWSGGVVLVLVLGSLQALALGPLRHLRRLWPLSDRQAIQPRQAWRWIGSSWIHGNRLEAPVNLLVLLILLGDSPLPLADVVLRYGLTALACLLPSVLLAHRWDVRRRWSGASGPISALIALAAGLSLLHWREHHFETPLFSVPAWVLLLVYGALQLGWRLPRLAGDSHSRPWQRLLSSSWSWGLLLGLGWALLTRVQELLKLLDGGHP